MNNLARNTIVFSFAVLLWSQCSLKTEEKAPVKTIVYEGMSSQELGRVLGEPNQKDSVSTIYLVEQNKDVLVEKWFYDKRTVLLINDTVKVPNVK